MKISNCPHPQIVHERLKAFKCEHCDFAAYVSSHLTYHMRSKHEKRMDFECDECDKAFVDMRALRSHKSAVHLKVIFTRSNLHNCWSFWAECIGYVRLNTKFTT